MLYATTTYDANAQTLAADSDDYYSTHRLCARRPGPASPVVTRGYRDVEFGTPEGTADSDFLPDRAQYARF